MGFDQTVMAIPTMKTDLFRWYADVSSEEVSHTDIGMVAAIAFGKPVADHAVQMFGLALTGSMDALCPMLAELFPSGNWIIRPHENGFMANAIGEGGRPNQIVARVPGRALLLAIFKSWENVGNDAQVKH